MDVPTVARRSRRAPATLLLLVTIGLVAAMTADAGAAPGPEVAAAGIGTKAALGSEQCGDDGLLAIPYPNRAPCTAPLKKGQSNGGATAMGVTKDKIRVVLFLGTHEQQDVARNQPGATAPIDLSTNLPGYIEETYRDWQAVMSHSYNLWGREFEFIVKNPTGPDEAAQRADALAVAELKPFAVVSSAPATAGGGQVFASALVQKKIIVFYGGITNEEAAEQAPYRWLGGFDNNAAAVNAVQFAARQLKGETAKWSGDFTDEKRVFGTIHPESGIDWQWYESTAKKEKLKSAADVVYSVPLDTSTTMAKNQEEAPTLVAKLKDSGVTTVLLFTSFGMNREVYKAADSLDYHPEWVFTGMGAQDIEITARFINGDAPEQMKHTFGIGNLPLYVAGIDDPQRVWFNWYWGGNQGVYAAGTAGTLNILNNGVMLAGPKLTAAKFQQGLFSKPLSGGAADSQVQSFLNGYGPAPGLPYDVYSQVGLDYAVMWWNPDRSGPAKIIFTEGQGVFMYPNNAKRYAANLKGAEWPKGEPKLFDESNSISQFDSLPPGEEVPDYPCTGCPSESS
jgi:hypothetical protein